MCLFDVGNYISLGIAFIAIFSLFLQSRSTKKQVKLQNFIEYTKRYQEIILNFPENINESYFSFDNLSLEKRQMTMRYMRAYFDLCYEEFILHRMKYIPNDLWSIWEEGMNFAFSKIAFREAWAIIKKDTRYSNDFLSFVETVP